MDLIKISKALEPLARKAGEKIMEVYAKDPKAKFKGDGSPVTEDFLPLAVVHFCLLHLLRSSCLVVFDPL